MNRTQTLAAVKAAAMQGDIKACTRLYIEGNVSRAAYDHAVNAGRAASKQIEDGKTVTMKAAA